MHFLSWHSWHFLDFLVPICSYIKKSRIFSWCKIQMFWEGLKILKKCPNFLTLSNVKNRGRFFKTFFGFLEYLNFKTVCVFSKFTSIQKCVPKCSLEMILLNFSLNLENNKGIYVLVNKKSKNQHVMKYKTLECPFW